ncbi:ABC transporter substrate-binding protein [Mesorhizobium sp. 1B3]|uniref:ABC transporter substrate-binding protein n=1 Tax=Mesorhizobium sp. 1B3 TaxID=3243599 RepID=UPI003D9853BE
MKRLIVAALAAVVMGATGSLALALDKVTLGTNWLAQGGHGGFYQALADGTYEKYGLEVEIKMGGPQVNNRPMLSAGRLDFLLAGSLLMPFDDVRNGVPTIAVAAFYQKNPESLIAHKGVYKDLADAAKAPTVLLSKDGQFSFWRWLVNEYGFRDEQVRPYNFSLAQFLSDKQVVQQAYATAEPIYAAAEGAEVETFLFADYGYNTYSNVIQTRTDLVENNPDLVQRFVSASIEGWYNFLYGDHSKGYEAILRDNPELTAEKLDKEIEQVKKLGLMDSGAALEKGIGSLDMATVKSFYELAVKSGIVERDSVDITKAATDQFTNKGVGLDIKQKLTGQ